MIEGTGHLGLQLVGDSPAGQKCSGQPSRVGEGSGQSVDLLAGEYWVFVI